MRRLNELTRHYPAPGGFPSWYADGGRGLCRRALKDDDMGGRCGACADGETPVAAMVVAVVGAVVAPPVGRRGYCDHHQCWHQMHRQHGRQGPNK